MLNAQLALQYHTNNNLSLSLSPRGSKFNQIITEVLNDSLENVSHSFVSKAEMQKVVIFFSDFDLSILRAKKVFIFVLFQIENKEDSDIEEY
jgi:hypothetical protein